MASLLKPCSTWDQVHDHKYGPSAAQRLDAYLPKGNGTTTNPLFVIVHGGGWEGGTENFDMYTAWLLSNMVRRGFAVASVHYRLSGEAPHPAQIKDVLLAIRELRYKASAWRIWPDKIGLWGMSAGSQLAALAALAGTDPTFQPSARWGISNDVHAVVADYGPSDFRAWVTSPGFTSLQDPNSIVGRLFGRKNVLDIPEVADAASPALRVGYDPGPPPPMWARHGTNDTVVPISQSRYLRDAYTNAGYGSSFTLTEKAGAVHADAAFYSTTEVQQVGNFFDRHLQP